jgi:hypothetical protein
VDEVNVEVVVVVLLELNGVEVLDRDADIVDLKLSEEVLKNSLVLLAGLLGLRLLLLSGLPAGQLDLDGLGLECLHWCGGSCLSDRGKISALSDALVVGDQVGGSGHEMHV